MLSSIYRREALINFILGEMKLMIILDCRWIVGLVWFILAQISYYKTLAVEPFRDECGKVGIFKKKHQGI